MKSLPIVLCLILLLEMYSCFPTEQIEVSTPKALDLAHSCVKITLNVKKDDRSPILIVHGFSGYKEIYMGLLQVLALKTGRRVCVVDLRNHGDSPWSDEADSKAMASDLNLLMKTINADKLVILGHSMGGKVAVEFALTNPDKVEKLIVEDMRPNGLSDEVLMSFVGNMDAYRIALNLIPKNSTEKEAKKIIADFLFKGMNFTLDLDGILINSIPIKYSGGKWSWKMNLDVLERIFKDPLLYWPTSSGKSESPALFIYGEISPFKVFDVKEEILDLFPKAQLYEVKGGNHILNGLPDYRDKVVNFINAKD